MGWRRKKRLFVVTEALDEPEEEPSPYTNIQLRLAVVATGHFEPWDGFSSQDIFRWKLDGPEVDDNPDSVFDSEDEVDFVFSDDDTVSIPTGPAEGGTNMYCLMATEGKGEAELIRLLFTFADHMFNDVIITEDEIEEVVATTRNKRLPILTRAGEMWEEMPAVARTLARSFYLLGDTNHEHLVVEATFERLRFLKIAHHKALEYLVNGNQPKDKMDWATNQMQYDILPPVLEEWNKLILASSGPYIVASGMTLADLAIMDFLDQYSATVNLNDLMADCLALSDLVMLVRRQPKIFHYLTDRATRD